jgi:hypothetical protein
MIFYDFWAFNRAGKTVTKIGIYSKPPLKSQFYSIFIEISIIFVPIPFFLKIYFMPWGLNNFTYTILLKFVFPILVFNGIGYSEFFWLFEFFRDV